MRTWIPTAVLGAALLLACDQEPADERPVATDREAPAVATADAETSVDLFVERPTGEAQLLFVAEDHTDMPGNGTGAVFVPLSTFSVERDGIPNEFPEPDSMAAMLEAAGVQGDRFLVVGEPIPAGRAYAGLDYLGFGDRTTLLDGGPDALQQNEDEARAPARPDERTETELDVDVREDMIVDAEWVHERLDDPTIAILDARPPDQFSGETPGEGIDRPGHIPGARNVFWETLIRSPEEPRLKEEAELRRLFEEAGVQPGDTIVAYCRTGGQGSFLYTVARHLGYDVRLYDGSYVDWSRTDYPVER